MISYFFERRGLYGFEIKRRRYTDIYCYVMMIIEVLLNNKNVFRFETDEYKSLIDLLDKIGFDSRLVNSLSSVMDDDAKNVNLFTYLDTIEEEKVKQLRKSFDAQTKIRWFEY